MKKADLVRGMLLTKVIYLGWYNWAGFCHARLCKKTPNLIRSACVPGLILGSSSAAWKTNLEKSHQTGPDLKSSPERAGSDRTGLWKTCLVALPPQLASTTHPTFCDYQQVGYDLAKDWALSCPKSDGILTSTAGLRVLWSIISIEKRLGSCCFSFVSSFQTICRNLQIAES